MHLAYKTNVGVKTRHLVMYYHEAMREPDRPEFIKAI